MMSWDSCPKSAGLGCTRIAQQIYEPSRERKVMFKFCGSLKMVTVRLQQRCLAVCHPVVLPRDFGDGVRALEAFNHRNGMDGDLQYPKLQIPAWWTL